MQGFNGRQRDAIRIRDDNMFVIFTDPKRRIKIPGQGAKMPDTGSCPR
jgi:hypothetical protein